MGAESPYLKKQRGMSALQEEVKAMLGRQFQCPGYG